MKIKNPLDRDLNLLYKGQDYVIEAGVSKEFPADVVAQWITIYEFLKITSTNDKDTDEVLEEVEKQKDEKPKKKAKEDK